MSVDNDANDFPPVGYEAFADNYYKYHRDPKNTVQAMRICEAEGAHLSIVNSEKEAAYIIQMMVKFPDEVLPTSNIKDFILMGFHDAIVDGQYLTVDGKKNHATFPNCFRKVIRSF